MPVLSRVDIQETALRNGTLINKGEFMQFIRLILLPSISCLHSLVHTGTFGACILRVAEHALCEMSVVTEMACLAWSNRANSPFTAVLIFFISLFWLQSRSFKTLACLADKHDHNVRILGVEYMRGHQLRSSFTLDDTISLDDQV